MTQELAATLPAAAAAPLRHVVGEDVEKLVAGRRNVSDEEFLALAELDDDAYQARHLFGIEL